MIYQLLQSVRNVSFPNRPELITAASATGETHIWGGGTFEAWYTYGWVGGGGVLLRPGTHMGGGGTFEVWYTYGGGTFEVWYTYGGGGGYF